MVNFKLAIYSNIIDDLLFYIIFTNMAFVLNVSFAETHFPFPRKSVL